MALGGISVLGLMGWPLMLCSVIGLGVMLERAVFMARHAGAMDRLYKRLAALLENYRGRPKAIRDDLISLHLTETQRPFYKGVKALRLIGTISPMLGLLGTVLGIIACFRKIAASSGPVNPAMIADGLWEALLTTAVGLTISLLCLLAAQGVKGWADRMMETLCHRLNRLSLSFNLDAEEPKDIRVPGFTAQRRAA